MQVKAGENGYICKIKGIPRDLEGGVPFLESDDKGGFMDWLKETYGYEFTTTWAFFRYIKYNGGVIPTEWDPTLEHPNDPHYPQYLERLAEERYQEEHKVRCPYCRSDRVIRVSAEEKIVFSPLFRYIQKQWHCTNCNSEF